MTEAEPAAQAQAVGTETAELLQLVDRLESLLERSGLAELEVEVGGTGILLRRPAPPMLQDVRTTSDVPPAAGATASGAPSATVTVAPDDGADALHAVLAPLTGIFYTAPTPEASPYVAIGDTVGKGQVIGLIEAMKLFNEIKSDVPGRVVRIAAETGSLVKAKQPLIELELA